MKTAETCILFLDKTCSGIRPYEQTTTEDYEYTNNLINIPYISVRFGRVEIKNTTKSTFLTPASKEEKLTNGVEGHARKRIDPP